MKISQVQKTALPILRKHGITKAGLFGSLATGEGGAESDVDILVELGQKISVLEFVRIKLELEDALGKSVDLVEYQSVKPRLKERIFSEEIRVCG